MSSLILSTFAPLSPSCVIQVIELAETVRHVLVAGGKWINHGPLQWHSSTALMLSLDEVLTSVVAVWLL